jgi:ubiquitin
MTDTKALDLFLWKFTSPDKHQFSRPCLSNEYIYATDSVRLIRVNKDHITESFQENPSINLSIPFGNLKMVEEFEISGPDLQTIIDKIPLTEIYEDCPLCNGEGMIDCQCCGHCRDCIDCKGDGATDKVVGKEINGYLNKIEINKCYYDAGLLIPLIEASLFENKAIIIKAQSPNTPLYCQVGRMEILVCPCFLDTENEEIKVFKLK